MVKPATELSFLFVLQNVQVVKIVLVIVTENVRYVSEMSDKGTLVTSKVLHPSILFLVT